MNTGTPAGAAMKADAGSKPRSSCRETSRTLPPYGLHESRIVGRVAQRAAHLKNAKVQTTFEIDEGVITPDVGFQTLARNEFAGALEEQCQDLGRLRRKLDDVTLASQLSTREIEFEQSESTPTHLDHYTERRIEQAMDTVRERR
jgi:hypothetical protein